MAEFSAVPAYTPELVWVVPSSPTWGATRALGTLLEIIANTCCAGSAAWKADIAIVRDRSQKHLKRAFSRVAIRADDGEIPSSLEILLVPRRMVAVVVNAPINLGRGFPVPLGVISFEQDVLRHAHEYLEGKMRHRTLDSGEQIDWQALLRWTAPSQLEASSNMAPPGSPATQ